MGAPRKRRSCALCGCGMPPGSYVELRVLSWRAEAVEHAGGAGSHSRMRSRSMATVYMCEDCAPGAIGRVYETTGGYSHEG